MTITRIAPKLLQQRKLFSDAIRGKQVMVVTQNAVAKHYLKTLLDALCDFQCHTCILPDGEAYKTLDSWQLVLTQLTKHQHHRDTTLIALGGGIVGDITGFAAATYMRGVNYIQIPTTLLAQVDASVGGKTGVNLPSGKNLVGAFYQPSHAFVDIDTLKTLPEKIYRAGFAEIIKAALISDADFFTWLETNSAALIKKESKALLHAISQSRNIKQDIVNKDLRENGVRALLNLGHTFAHSIEAETHYAEFSHGEAVAIGLVLSATLSFELGFMESEPIKRIRKLLEQFSLPTTLPEHIKYDRLLARFNLDKKIQNKKWRFVLLNDIGKAFVAQVNKDALTQQFFSTT